jgi:hypothetical protein
MNQILLDSLKALKDHVGQIQTELGADWPEFVSELQSLPPILDEDKDKAELSRLSVKKFYLTCGKRDSVMAVLRQVLGEVSIEQILADRKLKAGGTGQPDEILIREIANRFQSLLENLEEIGQLETDQSLRGRGMDQSTKPTMTDEVS